MNDKHFDNAVAAARRALDQLDQRAPAVLDRDRRGGSAERDGYPSGGSDGGSRSSDTTSSTERIGLMREEKGAENRDDVAKVTRAILHHLDQLVMHAQAAVSQVALGEHLASPDGRSNPPTHCAACTRLVMCTAVDPIRSGYCDACRKAWTRYKAECTVDGLIADRSAFESLRRKHPAA